MERKRVKQIIFLFLVVPLLWGINSTVFAADMNAAMEECLNNEVQKAGDAVTIGELRAKCKAEKAPVAEKAEKEEKGIVEARIYTDKGNVLRPWTLMAHRPNYILLASYNDNPNNEPWREVSEDPNLELDNVEAQFQVSIKVPLAIDLFKKKMDIYAAYTVRSFWQVYNNELSSPFRETNYEPEAWLQFRNDWSIFGFKNSVNMIGFVHQSNGRNDPISRSWNRIFANFVFERDNLVFGIKPWFRISEDDEDDNNPDITDYMGHFQIGAAYKWKKHIFGLMLRNNLELSPLGL
jgi:phospholipase A1